MNREQSKWINHFFKEVVAKEPAIRFNSSQRICVESLARMKKSAVKCKGTNPVNGVIASIWSGVGKGVILVNDNFQLCSFREHFFKVWRSPFVQLSTKLFFWKWVVQFYTLYLVSIVTRILIGNLGLRLHNGSLPPSTSGNMEGPTHFFTLLRICRIGLMSAVKLKVAEKHNS